MGEGRVLSDAEILDNTLDDEDIEDETDPLVTLNGAGSVPRFLKLYLLSKKVY